MMALSGYSPDAPPIVRAKSLPRRSPPEATRRCCVCLGPFTPTGVRLYTCSHECSQFRRADQKRRADRARMARRRAEGTP